MTFQASLITLFPNQFPGLLNESILGRALQRKIWQLDVIDLRSFGHGRHKKVDDTCFGGGPGMVIRPDVAQQAIAEAKKNNSEGHIIYLTPRGVPLTQEKLCHLSKMKGVIIFCGKWEGLDERVIQKEKMEEISIGDYVLSAGEPAAFVLLDGIVRLLKNVVGDERSLQDESFSQGLLEYPHYTKPQNWEGGKVPDILLSGHHENIARWRKARAQELTEKRRPDMWAQYQKKLKNPPKS